MGTLPLYFELPEAVLVHGYLEPGLPLDEQNPSVLCGTMGGDRILRERYDRRWYELYEGDKPVIVGHHNYTNSDQPLIYRDKVFGLDTSCVHGKTLTGLLLPSFRFVSVRSRGNLWMQVRRAYLAAQPARVMQPPKPEIPWSQQDELVLAELIEKVRQANESLLSRLLSTPGFAELTPRQQAKQYASEAGTGTFANLMQVARLGKLDMELARKMLRNPGEVYGMLTDRK